MVFDGDDGGVDGGDGRWREMAMAGMGMAMAGMRGR